MEDMKWYRVTDPLSPLYGSDVRGREIYSESYPDVMCVQAMRRLDLLVGNRPFQLVAAEGDDLGIWIRLTHLQESPIQDDIVETTTDRPFGLCLNESEMTRTDGVTLRIARYEGATQIAVEDLTQGILRSATDTSHPDILEEWEKTIIGMFERGDDAADIAYTLEN
jgi:hypothetical protein